MNRVLPSQVVQFIESAFPWVLTETEGHPVSLGSGAAGALAAVIDFVDKIQGNLLVINEQAYAEFLAARAFIVNALRTWPTQGGSHELKKIPGVREFNPVNLLRQALAQCPDAAPSPELQQLEYVQDLELREDMKTDIDASYRSFAQGDWKAATVLAGSVVESLLLWALNRSKEEAQRVAGTLVAKIGKVSAQMEDWSLYAYIEVARSLSLIEDSTADQSVLGKDFRNLIHPGRAIRFKQKCDRATALSALAAVEHVARDIARIMKQG